MIKVVVGARDRVIAIHEATATVDLESYAGVKARSEKLEVVIVPSEALQTDVELDPDGRPTGVTKTSLVEGWRDQVVTE